MSACPEHAITAATGTLMSVYLFDDGVTPQTVELEWVTTR